MYSLSNNMEVRQCDDKLPGTPWPSIANDPFSFSILSHNEYLKYVRIYLAFCRSINQEAALCVNRASVRCWGRAGKECNIVLSGVSVLFVPSEYACG